jgi:hypothetical protein
MLASAQTPDEEAPAEEEACDKYVGEGARHGLCVVYCEAQDCDGLKPGADPSCDAIRDRFVDYSIKKGYLKAFVNPYKTKTIDCWDGVACRPIDREKCGGREVDCWNKLEQICEPVCTATYDDERGGCLKVLCQKCVVKIE